MRMMFWEKGRNKLDEQERRKERKAEQRMKQKSVRKKVRKRYTETETEKRGTGRASQNKWERNTKGKRERYWKYEGREG